MAPPLVLLLLMVVAPAAAQWDLHSVDGREVITHLFSWKWTDVAAECERFLGPIGYAGIQVSPPNEYVLAFNTDVQRPWWESYQPVSYNLTSRTGVTEEFKDMVARCNKVGVRIYVDAVFNHMTGWWPDGTKGVAGSEFYYDRQRYPGVPFSYLDFNDNKCRTASGNIEAFDEDAEQVRNCKLLGMNDLAQDNPYVRDAIVGYLNNLISLGVAGFRVDACKHMWPGDLKIIYDRLDNLDPEVFGLNSRPYILQEVIDNGGEPITSGEYVDIGRVTEFKFSVSLGVAFRGNNDLKWLRNFGEEWGMMASRYAATFIDNHDSQREAESSVLTFRDAKLYKMATAFMLAWPYGLPRVMSSYYWDKHVVNGVDENNWQGPPHDSNYNIVSPIINSDRSCGGGWICEHRWRQIYNMVIFRNVVQGTDVTEWWDNDSNQIAFCRGSRGFIAINNDPWDLDAMLQTCLPAGVYCDVVSGSVAEGGGACTGVAVTVGDDGVAKIRIATTAEDGTLALHVEARV